MHPYLLTCSFFIHFSFTVFCHLPVSISSALYSRSPPLPLFLLFFSPSPFLLVLLPSPFLLVLLTFPLSSRSPPLPPFFSSLILLFSLHPLFWFSSSIPMHVFFYHPFFTLSFVCHSLPIFLSLFLSGLFCCSPRSHFPPLLFGSHHPPFFMSSSFSFSSCSPPLFPFFLFSSLLPFLLVLLLSPRFFKISSKLQLSHYSVKLPLNPYHLKTRILLRTKQNQEMKQIRML